MYFVSLFAAMMFKLLIIVFFTFLFDKKMHNRLEAFVTGWILFYILEISIIGVLSIFQCVTEVALWIILIIMSVVSTCGLIKMLPRHLPWKNIKNRRGVLLAIAVCMFVLGHALAYVDCTWDALVYEIPRVLLFAQKKSVFINMNSGAINIFTNEWNGEINALFYYVLSGNIQGISWGGAENFIYGVVVCTFVFQELCKSKKNSTLLAMAVMATPVTLLLTMVCKGDLLPMFLLPLCMILLSKYFDEKDGFHFILVLWALALAAGSKISMVPLAGLAGVIVFLHYIYIKRSEISGRLFVDLGLALYGVFVCCVRYIVNFFVYGNMFCRVEKANYTFENALNNIEELFSTLIRADIGIGNKETVFALYKDFGIVNYLVFIGLIFLVLEGRKVLKIQYLCLAVSLLFFLFGTQWYDWSFRYFAPWIMYIIIFGLAQLDNKFGFCKVYVVILYSLILFNIASSLVFVVTCGEVTQGSYRQATGRMKLDKLYANHIYLLEADDTAEDINDIREYMEGAPKVLICNKLDQAVSYLFGENNDVYFCTEEELDYMTLKDYDIIAIAHEYRDDNRVQSLAEAGYLETNPYPSILAMSVYIHIPEISEFSAHENTFTNLVVNGVYPLEGENQFYWALNNSEYKLCSSFENGIHLNFSTVGKLSIEPEEGYKLQILVDDSYVQELSLILGEHYDIWIPCDVKTGFHTIKLLTNSYYCPSDFGINGDNRKLALAVEYIGDR